MSYRARIQYAGAIVHVTARACEFGSDRDRDVFIATLSATCAAMGWRCLAFCLMANHYHLLLIVSEPNLSEGMQLLNGTYAKRFNAAHDRKGHVFESRFRSTHVRTDRHLRCSLRYIVLNPVGAGLTSTPADWPWSSYAATSGLAAAPPWLDVDAVLGLFGTDPDDARAEYRRFVCARLTLATADGLVPLTEIIDGAPESVLEARRDHRYTQRQIADHLGVSQATVSRLLRGHGESEESDSVYAAGAVQGSGSGSVSSWNQG